MAATGSPKLMVSLGTRIVVIITLVIKQDVMWPHQHMMAIPAFQLKPFKAWSHPALSKIRNRLQLPTPLVPPPLMYFGHPAPCLGGWQVAPELCDSGAASHVLGSLSHQSLSQQAFACPAAFSSSSLHLSPFAPSHHSWSRSISLPLLFPFQTFGHYVTPCALASLVSYIWLPSLP